MGALVLQKVKPPEQGTVRALVLAAAASVEQDTAVANGETSFVFVCDAAFYLTFSSNGVSGSITAPDPAAVAGDARTMRYAADLPHPLVISPRSRYFRAYGTGASVLRWYPG